MRCSRYKQTEVGVIPEDWVVASLGELGTFKNGINKDGSSGFLLKNVFNDTNNLVDEA